MAQNFSKLVDRIIEFLEIKIEQIKLSLIVSSSNLIAGLVSLILIFFISIFFLFFLSLGFASLINSLMQSNFWGEFIVAGCYLIVIITIALLLKNRKLQSAIEDLFVKYLNKDNDKSGE